jgi:thioredoxin reductase
MYSIETDCAVAIVGAGMAGMSAALTLGRARVKTILIDGATPIADSHPSYNFLTNDGRPKAEILRRGAAEIDRYSSVERRTGRVAHVVDDEICFELTLEDGSVVTATRVLFALGLPPLLDVRGLPGLAERLGTDVFTCPFCHGYEIADRPFVVIGSPRMDVGFVGLIANWSDDVVYLSHDGPEAAKVRAATPFLDADRVLDGRVLRLAGSSGAPRVLLEDGREIEAEAVFVSELEGGTSWPIIDACGVERGLHPVTSAPVYKTDAVGRTDNPRLFIIGDARTGFSTLVGAAHEGMIAGAVLTSDLVQERRVSQAGRQAAREGAL